MSTTDGTAPAEVDAGGGGAATAVHQPLPSRTAHAGADAGAGAGAGAGAASADRPSLASRTAGNVVRDVVLWRRKGLSTAVLAVSTAAWVVMEILGYKFVQVASWVGISAVTLLFLWTNLAPLFGKRRPDLSNMEISEESAVATAHTIRVQLEDHARRGIMVLVVDRDPLAFAQAVAVLGIFSWIGTWFDLLTLLYMGVLLSLTCPVIYYKHEGRIKGLAHCARQQGLRLGRAFDEKVVNRLRSRQHAKAKKTE
ncbi:hypothetical protein Taro_003536 [Colocasia esculenta]|uniref:Reticulon-like protein n=1 Tax=Colocasia esculenta TaxID=4460 RepID=A0A843TLX3_COLES|nr:hypothetical protein [Colocasia esculenta]